VVGARSVVPWQLPLDLVHDALLLSCVPVAVAGIACCFCSSRCLWPPPGSFSLIMSLILFFRRPPCPSTSEDRPHIITPVARSEHLSSRCCAGKALQHTTASGPRRLERDFTELELPERLSFSPSVFCASSLVGWSWAAPMPAAVAVSPGPTPPPLGYAAATPPGAAAHAFVLSCHVTRCVAKPGRRRLPRHRVAVLVHRRHRVPVLVDARVRVAVLPRVALLHRTLKGRLLLARFSSLLSRDGGCCLAVAGDGCDVIDRRAGIYGTRNTATARSVHDDTHAAAAHDACHRLTTFARPGAFQLHVVRGTRTKLNLRLTQISVTM
jgi:hypothetical protein